MAAAAPLVFRAICALSGRRGALARRLHKPVRRLSASTLDEQIGTSQQHVARIIAE